MWSATRSSTATPMRDDRRHDQDADHERALRQAAGFRRRRRHRRQASAFGRRRRVVLDGARRRRAWTNSRSRTLAAAGVKCMPIIDQTRPTTHKNAIVAGGYRLLKVDTLDNRSISERILRHHRRSRSAKRRPTSWCSAISATAFSTATPFRRLIEAIPANTFRVADSQVASRWGNILEFRVSI